MTKSKTLEQLRTEKERAETQLAQEQHKLERLENRKKYLEKGERTKRTHRLCNLGGTVESLAPEIKDLTRTEMTELMEYIFSLSEVQRAIWLSSIYETITRSIHQIVSWRCRRKLPICSRSLTAGRRPTVCGPIATKPTITLIGTMGWSMRRFSLPCRPMNCTSGK